MTKPRLDQGPDYERGFVDGMQHQMQSSVDKAVNRMAQPEQCRKEQRGNGEYVCNCKSGECPELAQPEQEPVTWRNAAIRVGEDLCSVGPFGYYDMTAEQWLDWALSVVTVHAPPPQRTWVWLTDEEIGAILEDPTIAEKHQGNWLVLPYSYARAVEAKLKEKNT